MAPVAPPGRGAATPATTQKPPAGPAGHRPAAWHPPRVVIRPSPPANASPRSDSVGTGGAFAGSTPFVRNDGGCSAVVLPRWRPRGHQRCHSPTSPTQRSSRCSASGSETWGRQNWPPRACYPVGRSPIWSGIWSGPVTPSPPCGSLTADAEPMSVAAYVVELRAVRRADRAGGQGHDRDGRRRAVGRAGSGERRRPTHSRRARQCGSGRVGAARADPALEFPRYPTDRIGGAFRRSGQIAPRRTRARPCCRAHSFGSSESSASC